MNIMKNGALFLLIILILGLILAPFLGGSYREGYTDAATSWANKVTLSSGVSANSTSSMTGKPSGGSYDNYDHFSGTSSPTVYYGPNGSTATVSPGSNGSYTITVTNTNGKTKQYTLSASTSSSSNSSSSSSTSAGSATTNSSSSTNGSNFANSLSSMMSQFSNKTFYGPNGGSARLFTGKDGQYAIEETLANGNTTIYTATNTYTYTYSNQQSGSSSTGSNSGSTTSSSSSSSAYPYSDFSAGYISGPNGNSAGYVTGPNGNTLAGTSINNANSQYNSSLPSGIPARMIPPGQEDLYILKSEVVPPVCPACPTSSACPRTEKCPPCPACARCPEPNFECKKVPNYNAVNDSYLPVPVLSDFSTFGM